MLVLNESEVSKFETNSKSEIQNSSSFRHIQRRGKRGVLNFEFRASGLFRISNFALRVCSIIVFSILLCVPVQADAAVLIPELKADAPPVPVDADSYAALLVADEFSGRTIYASNPAKKWPAASLTKLMTAAVFTSTPTNWNATGNVLSSDEVGGGRLQVPAGTTMSLRDVLYSAIVGSANNAAQALARMFDGRGMNAFVQEMNRMAQSMGLTGTVFFDASGMNPQNTVSAYDIADLLLASVRDGETQRAMVTPVYSFVTRSPVISKNIKNTNDLLFSDPDLVVTAGKTGYLNESRYNYTVRLHPKADPSKELIIVVFGAATREDSVAAAVKMARWALEACKWKHDLSSVGLASNMRVGDGGEGARILQRFLNANGFYVADAGPGSPGRETSLFGVLTKAALKRFQEAHRADILDLRGAAEGSGALDFLTRFFINAYEPAAAVRSAAGPDASLPPMGEGSRGQAVRTLQELLAREPDVYPEALVTGYFGPLTRRAVQRFQVKHGIVSSTGDPGYGYVGPKTRLKLAEMYGS
jgi:D-alanyl-D-alanine endopeptidase (penicillin-binding protein 7)